MKESKIYFLLGVSGSGKSTIINYLLQYVDNLIYVPSYTTRPMRSNEVEGMPYKFISKQEFEQSINKGEFLEYAFIHKSNYYGTKKKDLMDNIDEGRNVLKEVDVQGLKQIMDSGLLKGKYVSIFLNLPDKIMIDRIKGRGPITDEDLAHRLESTKNEREFAKQNCDHVINTNQPLENTITDILGIIYG